MNQPLIVDFNQFAETAGYCIRALSQQPVVRVQEQGKIFLLMPATWDDRRDLQPVSLDIDPDRPDEAPLLRRLKNPAVAALADAAKGRKVLLRTSAGRFAVLSPVH